MKHRGSCRINYHEGVCTCGIAEPEVGVVPPDHDLLGFCEDCFRVRWLARIREWKKGFPHGTCRQCEREKGDG